MSHRSLIIRVNAVGIAKRNVYLVHENGGMPGTLGSDYLNHQFSYVGGKVNEFILPVPSCLQIKEKFKIVAHIPEGETEAQRAYISRIQYPSKNGCTGAHVGKYFDFDPKHNMLGLLAFNFPIVRPEDPTQMNALTPFEV